MLEFVILAGAGRSDAFGDTGHLVTDRQRVDRDVVKRLRVQGEAPGRVW